MVGVDASADILPKFSPPVQVPRVIQVVKEYAVIPVARGQASKPPEQFDMPESTQEFGRYCEDVRALNPEFRMIVEGYPRIVESLRDLFLHSPETAVHSMETGYLVFAAAKDRNLPPERLRDLVLGAALHDVGKLGVPKAVIEKPGKFDHQDRQIMNDHTIFGFLENYDSEKPYLAFLALSHHSMPDDTKEAPYPFNVNSESAVSDLRAILVDIKAQLANRKLLQGVNFDEVVFDQMTTPENLTVIVRQLREDLPILMTADIVHAFRSWRSYSPSMAEEKVRKLTSHLDPTVVDVMLKAYREFPNTTNAFESASTVVGAAA